MGQLNYSLDQQNHRIGWREERGGRGRGRGRVGMEWEGRGWEGGKGGVVKLSFYFFKKTLPEPGNPI